MNVSIGFTYPLDPNATKPRLQVELGNLKSMLGQLQAARNAETFAAMFEAMNEAGIQGVEIQGGAIELHQ